MCPDHDPDRLAPHQNMLHTALQQQRSHVRSKARPSRRQYNKGLVTRTCDHTDYSPEWGLLVFMTSVHILGPGPDNAVFAQLLVTSNASVPYHA